MNAAQRDQMLKLSAQAKPFETPKRWLPADPSAAFICCIGAGPWKYGRRRKIQHEALQKLGGLDISQLSGAEKWFPLDWQNEMLKALMLSLRRVMSPTTPTMKELVETFRELPPTLAREEFYRMCGRPHGTKVLSLFLRDFVGVPCFPIDRHVRRALQEHKLPTKELDLLDMCAEADVDPIPIARLLIDGKLDGGNPDWSKWPAEPAAEKPSTTKVPGGLRKLNLPDFRVGTEVVNGPLQASLRTKYGVTPGMQAHEIGARITTKLGGES